MLDQLKIDVCDANRTLVDHDLVTLTWGNVSGIDRQSGRVVIKPSGVDYHDLLPEHMVVVDLDGNRIEGELNPSSDTATHVWLYRSFPAIGGVTHTHSRYATMYSQCRREIPCLGTTHADHFHGPVPVTRPLTESEVAQAYEANTGKVITERFADLDPIAMPAVLVAGHAPFAWGPSAKKSVENAVALEAVAQMTLGCQQIMAGQQDNAVPRLEAYVLEKHYQRKHGPDAYYGQAKSSS
ncbi:L-ribulose-5-phosphate 4-epimerase [Crateriforma conspicua]|uniref:L-ribulose-5-phosphate 4-epimerase n=1 Tax=Crateriforma conspicua TaxID=2527996 RepID=A0A5C6FS01_9PLAN|nr:L-ribulose-5-phosphate 4-epimerase AraD [Crateriforma conspicua]TWU63276.1 L-ribulose-5-phosphate 4-epimerase [Crateriforma conspicua]